jgi:tetratricopeptide (TPR) repeat protein
MKLDTIADLEKFLLIQEQAMGAASSEVATTASKLAELYFKAGNIERAEPLYRRAMEIRQKLTGLHREELSACEESLQRVLKAKKASERMDANPFARPTGGTNTRTSDSHSRNWNAGVKVQGNQSGESSNSNAAYGFGCSRDSSIVSGSSLTPVTAGDTSRQRVTSPRLMQDAIKEAEVELDLFKQVVGKEHPNIADMLTRLADLYCRLRLYSKMEPILIEALRIREASCGTQHPSVATELKNLARLYLVQERYAIAEPLFKRALMIRERSFGRDHARVADIEEQYAVLLRKTSRDQQAEALERHVQKVKGCSGDCVQPKQTNSIIFKSI